MELNFLQSILFGLISGLAEILPVSAQAHKVIMLKIFGAGSEPGLLRLILHMSALAGLYYGCHSHITRMLRAQKMLPIPMEKACLGTSSTEAKKRELTLMVSSVRSARWVPAISSASGSLKPM